MRDTYTVQHITGDEINGAEDIAVKYAYDQQCASIVGIANGPLTADIGVRFAHEGVTRTIRLTVEDVSTGIDVMRLETATGLIELADHYDGDPDTTPESRLRAAAKFLWDIANNLDATHTVHNATYPTYSAFVRTAYDADEATLIHNIGDLIADLTSRIITDQLHPEDITV